MKFLSQSIALLISAAFFTSCGNCWWEPTSESCKEQAEFWENEEEREDRMCNDTLAIKMCIAEQELKQQATTSSEPTDIASLCKASTPQIKCRERDKK